MYEQRGLTSVSLDAALCPALKVAAWECVMKACTACCRHCYMCVTAMVYVRAPAFEPPAAGAGLLVQHSIPSHCHDWTAISQAPVSIRYVR